MTVYLDLVSALNFLVDFLLFLGTNRLCGYPPRWGRMSLGALLGGIYGGICLIPGFSFLGNFLWRVVFLLLIGSISFGFSISGIRRTLVFLLLSMALGGIALASGNQSFWGLLWASLGLTAICVFGFRTRLGATSYVPVELQLGEKSIHITALLDTGNQLQDPITGRPVLVVGAEIANRLTGLTGQELSAPIETISRGNFPGLRLVPYHCVGQSGGMLLALRIPKVKIGNWKGSSLVAFSPVNLCTDGAYQALTGGIAS